MGLFERVFRGSDEMYAKAEAEVKAVVAELGREAPMKLPGTAYFLACIDAYLGIEVETLGDLEDVLPKIKEMMTPGQRTANIFRSGVGTAIAAEVIEACKYARDPEPYAGTPYHGHFVDAECRELGVPLVTKDIPGFVVMIGPAPSVEEAVTIVKGYQSRGIFVFLIGGIIDQLIEGGFQMGWGVRAVAVGPDIWAVGHIISFVVRCTMIFGAIAPGDWDAFHEYTISRIFAFVNAYAPVDDLTLACGAGAIKMGFPVITNDDHDPTWPVPKSLIVYKDTKDWIETSLEARDIKIKVTNIDIPVAFSTAYEGEIIRKSDMQVEMDGSRMDCVELVQTKDITEVEDHLITVEGPDFDAFEPGTKINIAYVAEVAGKAMQPDFEGVFERRFHTWINYMEGVMHTGQRNQIRIRVSNDAYDKGLRLQHFAEVAEIDVAHALETGLDDLLEAVGVPGHPVDVLRVPHLPHPLVGAGVFHDGEGHVRLQGHQPAVGVGEGDHAV